MSKRTLIKSYIRRIKNHVFTPNLNKSEIGDLQLLKERIQKKDLVTNLVIFDVGAYKGEFSKKLLSTFPMSKIYSFEPFSNSFDHLKEVAISQPEINAFQYALGEKASTSMINVNSFAETNSIFASHKTNSYIDSLTKTISQEEIRVKTLDEIVVLDIFKSPF